MCILKDSFFHLHSLIHSLHSYVSTNFLVTHYLIFFHSADNCSNDLSHVDGLHLLPLTIQDQLYLFKITKFSSLLFKGSGGRCVSQPYYLTNKLEMPDVTLKSFILTTFVFCTKFGVSKTGYH